MQRYELALGSDQLSMVATILLQQHVTPRSQVTGITPWLSNGQSLVEYSSYIGRMRQLDLPIRFSI